MQYEDWKYHHSHLPPHEPELGKAIEALRPQFMQELESNPKIAEYLAPYDPKWVQKFKEDYVNAKCEAVRYSKYTVAHAEQERELRYREDTEEVFDAILQKKLFNLQLLWRAEQITLPGIRTSWDFTYWAKHIRSCPFIEPVTEAEISAMRQFLQSENYDVTTGSWLCGWQSHHDIMVRDGNGNFPNMPEWYEWYDGRLGTGALLLLPNIRGEREEHYRRIGMKEEHRIAEAKAHENPQPLYVPSPPSIHCGLEQRVQFAKVADDEIFQLIFQQDLDEYRERCQAEEAAGVYDIEMIYYKLLNVTDPPPVRGGLNWREALERCWKDYLTSVIAEDLDLVWDEYNLLRDAGLLSMDTNLEGKDDFLDCIVRHTSLGLKLCGAPDDLPE